MTLNEDNCADMIDGIIREDGRTLSELAKRSGVSRDAISTWKKGASRPRVPSLIPLLCFLEACGYCLKVGEHIINMRTVDGWYDSTFDISSMDDEKTLLVFGARRAEIQKWSMSGNMPLTHVWKALGDQTLEVVRLAESLCSSAKSC